ncbi:calcium-binding protein [Sinorhizobium fredii]|uniref:calcium-binding protein n=1 Tax=Rhizobium fredii TaxID=380 RepID=UPI003511C3C1
MAKITVASNYSLNMSDFDFSTIYYGTSYVQTGTLFRVSYSNGVLEEFRGTELTYNAFGEPITGTITSYAAWYNGQQLFKVEGSIAVTKIVAAAQTVDTGDDLGVIIEVLKGNDTITGGNIADVLFGFDGNGGNDLLYGYAGNDTVIGGTGGDRIDGGAGSDTASYATASAGVTASLAAALSNTNDAKGDTYYYIENLLGSRYGDTLAGNSGANSLTGGDGNDTLIGGAGADKLYGGNGTDTASYANAAAAVIANLSNTAVNIGDAKGDLYSSIENLIGSKYADQLYGNTAANSLTGGAGNDLINASAGNDWIYGATGADRLTGGTGADRFVFKALAESAGTTFDTIYDFLSGEQDRIDLSALRTVCAEGTT